MAWSLLSAALQATTRNAADQASREQAASAPAPTDPGNVRELMHPPEPTSDEAASPLAAERFEASVDLSGGRSEVSGDVSEAAVPDATSSKPASEPPSEPYSERSRERTGDNPRTSHPDALPQGSQGSQGPQGPDEPEIPEAREEPAPVPYGNETWIFAGGLVRALEQTGMVEGLLASGSRPSIVYGWGLATAPAILCSLGDPLEVRRSFERLRGQRLITAAVLSRNRWVRCPVPLPRVGESLHAVLHEAAPEIELLLDVEGRFLPIAVGTLASVLDSASRVDSREERTLARAISGAAERGSLTVLVLGRHEAECSGPQVTAAIETVRAAGGAVHFVPPVGSAKSPSVLELLLPGSGRVDRLVNCGREAGLRWMEGRRHRSTG
jgi:hypothetical protein